MIQKCTNGIEALAEFQQFLPIRALGVASTPSFIAQKNILHNIQCNENLLETPIFLKNAKGWNEDVGFLPILVSSPWFDRTGRWMDAIFLTYTEPTKLQHIRGVINISIVNISATLKAWPLTQYQLQVLQRCMTFPASSEPAQLPSTQRWQNLLIFPPPFKYPQWF